MEFTAMQPADALRLTPASRLHQGEVYGGELLLQVGQGPPLVTGVHANVLPAALHRGTPSVGKSQAGQGRQGSGAGHCPHSCTFWRAGLPLMQPACRAAAATKDDHPSTHAEHGAGSPPRPQRVARPRTRQQGALATCPAACEEAVQPWRMAPKQWCLSQLTEAALHRALLQQSPPCPASMVRLACKRTQSPSAPPLP